MYKIIIVDDEKLTRKGICKHFDWESLGIEMAGQAANGSEALELIESVHPDIILTDVKMPIMNGVELALKVRSSYPNISIIFISGYDDTEYLRNALSVEAIDYILKPIDFSLLKAALEKAISKIELRKSYHYDLEKTKNLLKDMLQTLRENFFFTLLSGTYTGNERNINEKLKFLETDLTNSGNYFIFSIVVNNYGELFESTKEYDRNLALLAISNVAEELANDLFLAYAVRLPENELALLICAQDENAEDEILKLANHIANSIENALGLTITIGIGRGFDMLSDAASVFFDAKEAAHRTAFVDGERILVAKDVSLTNDYIVFRFEEWEQIKHLLTNGNFNAIQDKIEAVIETISEKAQTDKRYYVNLFTQILIYASRVADFNNLSRAIDFNIYIKRILDAENLVQIKQATYECLKLICSSIDCKSPNNKNIISKIDQYIKTNFAKSITVNEIAKEFKISNTYLCYMYKKETGRTVNDSITLRRMEKANELLEDHSISILDICFAVGYSEQSYFTKLFKKHYGVTPSECRKRM